MESQDEGRVRGEAFFNYISYLDKVDGIMMDQKADLGLTTML